MPTLIKAETIKLWKSFPLKIVFFLMFGLSIMTSLSSLSYVDSPDNVQAMEIALGGYDAFLSSLRDTPTIAMIGIIVIALIICSDFENRTLHMEIAAGYSRTNILLSKVIAITTGYFFVWLPYPLGRFIFQGIFIGFGTPITFGIVLRMIAIYSTIILTGIALNSLTICLAFVLRKSILVMGISFIFIVLGGNALLSFGYSNPTIGAYLAKTPLGFCKALAAANYTPALLVHAAVINLLCISVFLTLTYFLFHKSELK